MDNGILVIDVSATVPADDAAKILSEPLGCGYYLKHATLGEPMRVLYAQYAPGKDDNKCDEELRAMDVVVAHRGATSTRIVQMLWELGINRGTTWVNKTRDEL